MNSQIFKATAIFIFKNDIPDFLVQYNAILKLKVKVLFSKGENLPVAVSHSAYVNGTSTTSTRSPGRIRSNGCSLPNHPVFGNYSIHQSTFKPTPGERVPPGTVLQVSCQNNYKLEGDALIACIDGAWSSEIGQCLKTCPSIYSTAVMRVTCVSKYNRRKENCTDPVDGTIAQFRCADFYEAQSLDRHSVLCYDGRWTHRTPECVPTCGQKSISKSPTLIIGGSNPQKGDYPWHAALYKVADKDLICEGSLINQRVILTAAHCVTDQLGKVQSKELYIVAVGKYHRRFNYSEDREAQFSPIYEIYIPKQYKGDVQNYFGDIAIIVTKETFILSSSVQPVCVDWVLHYPLLVDPTGTKHGYVADWGYKNSSNELKELRVPLVSNEECGQALGDDNLKYLTDDKLCAGYLDKGLSPCRVSGGGLVTEYENKFYIVGVASVCPQARTQEGGCNCDPLYTRVSYYIDNFILEKEARFRP